MKKVIDFLKENMVMTMASSSDDKPRASILEYYMIGDSLIFCTSGDSIKGKNLKHNKHVSFSVFNAPRYVTVDGHVTPASAAEVAEYNRLMLKNHPEFKDMDWGPMVYYRVVIEEAYYSDMSKGMVPPEVFKA